ncbi:MAG: hypothetical protein AB8B87_09920 [Granulosicoccus sp.]
MLKSTSTLLCAVMMSFTGSAFAQEEGSQAANAKSSGPAITGIDLRYINDSNPAKAEFDRDIEATGSFLGRVTGTFYSNLLVQQSNLLSGISFNGSASYEINGDIEELGESRYRVSADWFREYTTASLAPFYRLSLGLGMLDSESAIRDSSIVDVSASVNFQPTNFFDTTLGVRYEVREAETEVFDTSKATVSLTANFSPLQRLILRAGLRFVTGNEVSTATPTISIVNAQDVIEPDDAFGGFEENRFAYLLDADSTLLELGLGYVVSDAIETNLLYRIVSTSAAGDIGYDRNMLELTFSYSL